MMVSSVTETDTDWEFKMKTVLAKNLLTLALLSFLGFGIVTAGITAVHGARANVIAAVK